MLQLGFLGLVFLYDRRRIRIIGPGSEATWRARRSIATLAALLCTGAAWALIFVRTGLTWLFLLLAVAMVALLAMVALSWPIRAAQRAVISTSIGESPR